MELRPGAQIDRYVVVRRLGAGGMGVVYLARHRLLETLHAIKLVRDGDPSWVHQLGAEGRAQASLRHRHVVPVLDTVEVAGCPGLVMEYVVGPTLADLLAADPVLSLPEIDALGRGVVGGVAAAHTRGWVHRDLKPANVLVQLEDHGLVARVTDFGLARALEGPDRNLTRHAVGTHGYMSLEQLRGDPPDPAMDVFALGATLFELVEGRPAFPTIGAWRDTIRGGPAPAPSRADLPERMRLAIARSLSDHRERVPDARALLAIWEGGTELAPDPFRPETLATARHAIEHLPNERFGAEALTAGEREHLGQCTSCRSQDRRRREIGGIEAVFSGQDPAPSGLSTWATRDARSATVPPRGLPSGRDLFLGRTEDLAELAARVDRGDRLTTVHGPGGIGKTRLVVEFLRADLARWPGGIWFCDLSGARTAEAIGFAVARVFDVSLGADPIGHLGRTIDGHGRCLVVLDNFEQVVAHAGETVGRWVDVASRAVFVVTSRVVLGLGGEQVLGVEPLTEEAAARLFVARACAARRDFATGPDVVAVRELVRLLDGLPLAIELCAPRVRALTVPQMVDRVGRFRMATSGPGRPARQATLRATLDWSWDLLTDWEKSAFAQCSVFAGGFELDAAEAVLDPASGADAPWVADLLHALVDRSLLRVDRDHRFVLLSTLGEYAAERLGADPPAARATGQRHLTWYAALADRAAASDVPRIRELENFVVAARRGLRSGDVGLAARAALGAAQVYELRGPHADGSALVADVLSAGDPARVDPGVALRLRRAEAVGAERQGRFDEARALYDALLVTCRASGDRAMEGRVLGNRGIVDYQQGRLDEARVAYEEAIAIHREAGDRRYACRMHTNLGLIHYEQGRMEVAAATWRTAIAIAQEVGERRTVARASGNLANLHVVCGRPDEADELFEAALAAAREVGDRPYEATVLGNRANLRREVGPTVEARDLYRAARALLRSLGDRRGECTVLGNHGALEVILGDLDQAEGLLDEALDLARAIGLQRSVAVNLVNLGGLWVARGRPERARPLLDEGLAAARACGRRSAEAAALGGLAEASALGGDFVEAARLLGEARQAAPTTSDLADTLVVRARVARLAGDVPDAEAAIAELREVVATMGAGPGSDLGIALARLTGSR